jgi:hypothetical protein
VAQLFTLAVSSGEAQVTWEGQTAGHVFSVVKGSAESPTMREGETANKNALDDFAPMVADGPRRVPATAADSAFHPYSTPMEDGEGSSLEAGVLVHRALEAGSDDLEALLRDDERAGIDDVASLLVKAREALASIRAHPDVLEIFGDGASIVWRRHEVPFSWTSLNGTIVRGTFDCLLERLTGVIEVLEFKTGQPTPEHQRQLEVYVAAAQALFPTRVVRGRLIYSSHFETTFERRVRLT